MPARAAIASRAMTIRPGTLAILKRRMVLTVLFFGGAREAAVYPDQITFTFRQVTH
ncbi:hypothetical protein GCM10009113_10930 [Marinobacter szutsaonensis]